MNAIDKSKKFLENFNSFSITDIIKNTYDFWNGFDLLTQVLLFNALSSLLLSSLLGSYIFSIYGNYLINRYDLVNKYPKLRFLINLRSTYLKYSYKYYAVLAISTLLLNLFANICLIFS